MIAGKANCPECGAAYSVEPCFIDLEEFENSEDGWGRNIGNEVDLCDCNGEEVPMNGGRFRCGNCFALLAVETRVVYLARLVAKKEGRGGK